MNTRNRVYSCIIIYRYFPYEQLYTCFCPTLHIHPIFVFRPLTENKKQTSQSQFLLWKGTDTFFYQIQISAGAWVFAYTNLGKNRCHPRTNCKHLNEVTDLSLYIPPEKVRVSPENGHYT